MNIKLNSIWGIDDAIASMYFSKRTWNQELDNEIRNRIENNTNRKGFLISEDEKLTKDLNLLAKWGVTHITLLRFIQLSFVVEGLHRGGQDDWDSHARRFDNRIIRSSTRLANFGNEKSEYYKDKILTTDEALKLLNINVPDSITANGIEYIKSVNGYVQSQYKDDRDVSRGLYMLSIPSNFIFQISLCEWSHVYKERYSKGTANPEVKDCAEECQMAIEKYYPMFNKEFMLKIHN